MIRRAQTGAALDAYVSVWNAITPDEPTTVEQQRERRDRDPDRLYLLALDGGAAVGTGFAGRSDSPGRGFVAPRVLPESRRRGIGTALLRELVRHVDGLGLGLVSAHVNGHDPGSIAFARRFGFAEVDRQVEQVRTISEESPAQPPPGVVFVTVAERPDLLREAYDLAVEGYADMATTMPVTISLEDWLKEEGTIPQGSVAALAGDEIVGYSGLCRHGEDRATLEDGLTVVRRSWRRRGLATALKRAKLAWMAENGVREVVTWTQRGNEGMRRVNEQLGYVYRNVTISVHAQLPLALV